MKKDIFKEDRNIGRTIKKDKFFSIEKMRASFIFDSAFPFHYHDYYELYTLKEGACTYRIEKNEYSLKKDDWVFVPAGISHKVCYTESPHERVLIYFSKEYIEPHIIKQLNRFTSNPVYTPADEDKEYLNNIVGRIVKEYENPDEYTEILYRNLIYELLIFFMRKPSFKGGEPGIDLIVAHVMQYIEHNFTQNLTLEDLADISSVSVSYLSRKFKQIAGMGISEYIQAVRINYAKQLLVQSRESIMKISDRCGFNDSNYFSYVFKQREGISPGKYRKNFL